MASHKRRPLLEEEVASSESSSFSPPSAPRSLDRSFRVEQQLDEILEHLHRMDKRDRMRTIGGFVKSLIAIIPVIVLLGSMWYLAKHGQEILSKVAQEAAKQAAAYSQESAGDFMKQFQDLMR